MAGPQPCARDHRLRAAALLLALGLPGAAAAGPPDDPARVARQLVAHTLGVPLAATRILSSTPREFPDGSLDCPAPGMAYAQVITPGAIVMVEADGRRFDVRVAGESGRICYRAKGRGPEPAAAGPLPGPVAEAARQDLARRLGVAVAAIRVLNVRHLTPGEPSPGCGDPCPAGSAACGYQIQLLVDQQVIGYVSQGDGVRPCPDIATR